MRAGGLLDRDAVARDTCKIKRGKNLYFACCLLLLLHDSRSCYNVVAAPLGLSPVLKVLRAEKRSASAEDRVERRWPATVLRTMRSARGREATTVALIGVRRRGGNHIPEWAAFWNAIPPVTGIQRATNQPRSTTVYAAMVRHPTTSVCLSSKSAR